MEGKCIEYVKVPATFTSKHHAAPEFVGKVSSCFDLVWNVLDICCAFCIDLMLCFYDVAGVCYFQGLWRVHQEGSLCV